jgi:hypothetical protein
MHVANVPICIKFDIKPVKKYYEAVKICILLFFLSVPFVKGTKFNICNMLCLKCTLLCL